MVVNLEAYGIAVDFVLKYVHIFHINAQNGSQ